MKSPAPPATATTSTSRCRSPETRAPTDVRGSAAATVVGERRAATPARAAGRSGPSRGRSPRCPARTRRRPAPRRGARAAAPRSRRRDAAAAATISIRVSATTSILPRSPIAGLDAGPGPEGALAVDQERAPVVVADPAGAGVGHRVDQPLHLAVRHEGRRSCRAARRGRGSAARTSSSPSANAIDSETPSAGVSALVCATYSAMPCVIRSWITRPFGSSAATLDTGLVQQRVVHDDQVCSGCGSPARPRPGPGRRRTGSGGRRPPGRRPRGRRDRRLPPSGAGRRTRSSTRRRRGWASTRSTA